MAHTFTNLLTHIIFSTKDRQPSIDAVMKPQLFAYMGGIVREINGKAFAIDGTADHIHMLVSLPPTLALSEALRIIKTNSSKWFHEKSTNVKPFRWQAGYGAFSVSRSNIPRVVRYIVDQERHHRKVSFQEEFIAFLEKHDISYDKRYIWE
jgi:putative transposase